MRINLSMCDCSYLTLVFVHVLIVTSLWAKVLACALLTLFLKKGFFFFGFAESWEEPAWKCFIYGNKSALLKRCATIQFISGFLIRFRLFKKSNDWKYAFDLRPYYHWSIRIWLYANDVIYRGSWADDFDLIILMLIILDSLIELLKTDWLLIFIIPMRLMGLLVRLMLVVFGWVNPIIVVLIFLHFILPALY